MKTMKTLLALPILLAMQCAFAQTNTHLKLSDAYPAAGEKITITYDSTGTAVDGKKDITASVFYLDNKDYPVADIDLKPNGKLLAGEITVPVTAKAFFIKINSGQVIDNNNGKGYIYLVYKDKQPVEGAYAMQGYFLAGMGNRFAQIKPEPKQGVDLYKKEFELHPDSKKDYQKGYYSLIATKPEYQNDVREGIKTFEKSNDEKDLMLAVYLLSMTNSTSADSLNTIVKTKFPDGLTVQNELGSTFSKEKNLVKKDSIYNAYIEKYPENTTDKNTAQDNLRLQLVSAYLAAGDMANYSKYESQIKNKKGLAFALNGIAYPWAEKGEHLADAEKLSKQSLDIISASLNDTEWAAYTSPAEAKKINQQFYNSIADTYALILFKENKLDEAFKYEQSVVDHSSYIDGEIYEHYIQILSALGQSAKAQQYAENAIKEGKGSDVIKAELRKNYIKIKGSENGYEQYLAPLETAAKTKEMADLAKTMINQPAPAFTLKDLDGKTVNLADLKGKVVVVDFWATWCGPCKASFPGMQLAVNKYKDDPNVKFLFVDTRETSANYTEDVKKFIADNKYTFHVLFDNKGANGKQGETLTAYDVPGIPTKFIIDKTGNIRFKRVGYYPGTPESLMDEVTDMVDMAGKPEAYASDQKSAKAKAGMK